MFFRSWLTFTVVIGIVQAVLSLLAVLQHDAIFADLLRQRMAVIAQTTASSYKPILSLGLPISMIRNGDAIVARAVDMDNEIRAVQTFNPSGIVVHSSEEPRAQSVSREILRQMQLSEGETWNVETETEILSGYKIVGPTGTVAGAVVVAYPKDRLAEASSSVRRATIQNALILWLAFSAAAFLILRVLLATPKRALARVEAMARAEAASDIGAASQNPAAQPSKPLGGLLGAEIARLDENLLAATRQYRAATAVEQGSAAAGRGSGIERAPEKEAATVATPPRAQARRSLAQVIVARLAPPAAIVITASAIILGVIVLRDVNRAIEPELAARTNLVGVIVSENVQRAVAAGAPLDRLVGAEDYFGAMLSNLPEVAYIAVATGRIVLEAGERIDPYLAPPRERKDVRSHPIVHDGEEIAYVVIDIDPAFISKRFQDVFLDISVVILVTVLIAFEVMVLLTSRSITQRLDRLQRLAAMQALGDFSKTAVATTGDAIASLTRMLNRRAEAFHAATRRQSAGDGGPTPLRLSYFTDIRLALFLFAAADELPLAFLPIYTRAAENLWPWLDVSVLISLPVAGYLVAIVIASPFARALTRRYGVRALFLAAALPMIGAHIGLYLAETAQEVILWRSVTGIGYALVSLACQDYVLDTAAPESRDRTLGTFTLVLFGGIFAGVALGGVLADRLGQDNVFLLSAGMIAVSALLSAWLIAPGVGKGVEESERLSLGAMLAPIHNWRFAALVFGLAVPANVLLQAFISYLVALTLDALGASTADIGRTLMLYFLGVILFGPLGGRLAEAGVAVSHIAMAGAALAGAGLLAFAVWPGEWVMVVAVLLAGVGHGFVRGAQVSLAMTIAERELPEAGTVVVLGSLRTLERVGSVLGLVLIAWLAGAVGYTAATGAVAAWTLVGLALFATAFLSRGPVLGAVR